MKDSDLLWLAVIAGGAWYLYARQQAATPPPPTPVAQALGPAVDAVTKLLNAMFTGQTDTLLGGRAPVTSYYSVPASNQLATWSMFPASPDPKQWYDAVQGA
jgi:hypothetical protein